MATTSPNGRWRVEITPEDLAVYDHGQVAVAELVHTPDRLRDGLVRPDRVGLARHHLADRGPIEVAPGRCHPHQEVALGEDAEELIALHDEDAAADVLGHGLDGVAHRLVGRAAHDSVALDQRTYWSAGHTFSLL